MMFRLASACLLGAFSSAQASGAQCGNTTSYCAAATDCCESPYSPTKFGCLVPAGALANATLGCGDGLATDPNGNVCCKMGPENPPSTTLPNVLIIGDSVSLGYTSLASKNVVKLLSSEVAAQHGPWDVSDGGAKNTAYGLVCLDRWLMTQAQQQVKWDAITYNFGLHDMTPNTTHCESLYETNLRTLTQRLAAVTDNLVFFTTTPFMPFYTIGNTVVEDLNAIARRVVAPYNVTVVDLYALVVEHCGPVPYTDCDICARHPCKFHYDDDGENLQAAAVADAIRKALASA